MMWFSKIKIYRRNEKGVVAVEFALLAAPFVFLIIGLIETSLYFATSISLEGATQSASRLVMTGQAQNSGDALRAFEEKLCSQVNIMLPCDDIKIEAIPIDTNNFSGAEGLVPIFDDEGNLVPRGFSPGVSDDVILIRAAYRYEFLTPMIGRLMQDNDETNNNSVLLMTTVVIRNEPYSFDF